MKSRGLFFLIGLLVGLALGFGAAQENVRRRSGEFLLRTARTLDDGIHRLLVKIRNLSGKNADSGTQAKPSAPAPEKPNPNSPISNAAYIREFVSIEDVTAKFGDTSKNIALVSGRVRNSGDRTPVRVEATLFFMGPDTIAFEAGSSIVQTTPLAPGSTQDFSVEVQNVPTNWVAGRVRVAVTGIAL